jgi:hypothetical protein
MVFYDYFDRIAITHLPDRKDRYDSLARKLRAVVLARPVVAAARSVRDYYWKLCA